MMDVSGGWKSSKGDIWSGSAEKATAVTCASVDGECPRCRVAVV